MINSNGTLVTVTNFTAWGNVSVKGNLAAGTNTATGATLAGLNLTNNPVRMTNYTPGRAQLIISYFATGAALITLSNQTVGYKMPIQVPTAGTTNVITLQTDPGEVWILNPETGTGGAFTNRWKMGG